MKLSVYSLPQLLNDAFRPQHGGPITTVSIAVVLNAVITNSIIGAQRASVGAGDLKHASHVNTLLGLCAQFNTIFLVFAALICAMLLYTSFGAIYDSRKQTISVMRLCGLSLKKIIRHHISEAISISGKAVLISAVAFLPLAWAYGEILPLFGLAPKDVSLGFHWEALVISALCVTVFVMCLAFSKPRRHYRMRVIAKGTKKNLAIQVSVFVLLAGAGLLLLLPVSPLQDDSRMILMLPWAAIVGLVYGPKLIHIACRIVSSRMRRTGKAPRLGVAIGRLETSMASRVNPILPLTIVLAFVVPLSAVMATGRSAAVAEVYDAVHAQTVADLHQKGAATQAQHFNSIDDQSVYIATSTDVYRQDDPYAAIQPLLASTDISRLGEFFPNIEVKSGDLNSVAGNIIAVTDRSKAIGDEVHVITGDRESCTFKVGAVVHLPSLINFDYLAADINPSCPAADFGRLMAYSQRTPESLRDILVDSQWDIESKSEWVGQGITKTVQNQRSALIVMFIVPLMMALFVTAAAMKSRGAMVRESSRVLAYLGATRSDFRRIAIAEAAVAVLSIVLFLMVVIALNALVIFPAAHAANVGITFDYILDVAFILITLIIVTGIYIYTSLNKSSPNLLPNK